MGGTRLRWLAVAIGVLAGLVVASPVQAQDDGVVFGVVTSAATGAPVAGACVTVFDDAGVPRGGCTDDAGRYEIGGLPTGVYRAKATAVGFSDLWARNKGSEAVADYVYVFFEPVELHFALRQGSGVLRGEVTDKGAPAGNVEVELVQADQSWRARTTTDAAGSYSFGQLAAGEYKVSFTTADRVRYQWAHQKTNFEDAETFTVADGQDTVVDEALIPLGVLEVEVRDATTGQPLDEACVSAYGPVAPLHKCGGTAGVVRIEDVPPAGYRVEVKLKTHFATSLEAIVPMGQATRVTAQVQPAAAIRTTIRDARTGAPVPNECVQVYAATAPGVLDARYGDHCADASGRLTIGPLQPDTYQLLVDPMMHPGVYGMQWVGERGGTGDRSAARRITTRIGTVVPIPTIRLDPPGSITVTVRSRATGQSLAGVCVYAVPLDPRVGIDFRRCTNPEGRFTVTGLGPYRWPLQYVHINATAGYAWQWSGGAADRLDAHTIQVRAGQTVAAPVELLRPSATITGRVLDPQGNTVFASVRCLSARTGEFAARDTSSDFDGTYMLRALAAQRVKIQYSTFDRQYWYRNADNFRTATPVRIREGQTITGIDLVTQPT